MTAPTDQSLQTSTFRWLVLFGVWLLYFEFGLVATSLAPIVSNIREELNLSSASMGSVLGSWQFIYIFTAIPAGLAIYRFGAAAMLLTGVGLVVASGFFRSFADTQLTMMLSIGLFGVGGPLISAGAPQMASQYFSEKQRTMAMGIYITAPSVAGILTYSQAIFMPLFDQDWRTVMQMWAWIGLLTALFWLVVWSMMRARNAAAGRHASSSVPPRTSPPRFDIGAVRAIFSDRNAVILIVMGAGILTIDHGLKNWFPEIIRSFGWTASEAGHLSGIPVLAGICGALIFPRLAVGERRYLLLRLLILMSGTGCLLISTGNTLPLVCGLLLVGLGFGALVTIAIASLISCDSVGPLRAGIAGGLFFSVAEIGGVGGPVIIGAIKDLTDGFRPALYVFCALTVVMLIGSFATRPRKSGTPAE